MRYALIIVLGACYFLGWLPPSLVVPALMAVSLLRPRTAGPTPRRGGYIAPQPSVSGGASQGTVARVRTYTGFSTPPGGQSAATVPQATLADLSRIIGRGGSTAMTAIAGAPGHLTTAARAGQKWDAYVDEWARGVAHRNDVLPGDCGCGDTAA